MRWYLTFMACLLAGCPATSMPTDALMRDAGPPDPNASANCRASALLPRGTYWIGSDVPRPGGLVSHGPAFEATFSADGWVTRFESTNACYLACVTSGSCTDALLRPALRDPAKTRQPAIYLSFDQAAAYCGWLGGRLLTDSEWEALARGPDGRLWPWFPPPSNPRRPEDGPVGDPATACPTVGDWSLAGCTADDLEPSPVGSFPNARGAFGHEDVIANAYEWVLGGGVVGYPPGPHTDPIFEDAAVPHIGRAVPGEVGFGQTARCLFTSPPEPLCVEE